MSYISCAKRYINVSNEVIKNIGKTGGCDVFRLYINILLNKDWQESLTTTPNILLKQIGRKEQYWEKQLRGQLKALNESRMIEIDENIDVIKLNGLLQIKILQFSGNSTELRCVNAKIFDLNTAVSNNTLFGVYAYLTMAIDKDLNYARVSKKNLANRLGLSVKTVEKAIKILDESGLITITQGEYDKQRSKNNCNKYRVHNYGDTIFKHKLGQISIPDRDEITAINQYENETERHKKIDEKIAHILDNPFSYSPCVIKGEAVNLFLDYFRKLEGSGILVIEKNKDLESIISRFSNALWIPFDKFIFKISKLSESMEKGMCKFLLNSHFPVFMLIEDDTLQGALKEHIKTIIT